MPLHEGITAEKIVEVIVGISTAPRKFREFAGTEADAEQKAYETAMNNMGVFILQALGFTFDEIRTLMTK